MAGGSGRSGIARAAGIVSAVTAGVALGAGVVGAAAATHFARSVVRRDIAAERPVVVTRVLRGHDKSLVWVEGEGAAAPGMYSFLFDPLGSDAGALPICEMGHARLGDVISQRGSRTVREILAVDRGTLAPGVRGRMTGWWYTKPEELGYRVEETTYRSELGDVPAWIVHPKRQRKKRWSVHVHGRGASEVETLRGVAPLARAGITSLVIRYRNDDGAPSSTNGRYGLGLSESRDVDAAIAEAMRRGAERVTLVGWSMGGTACLLSATQGTQRNVIDGLVLDSPAIDWIGLLASNGLDRRVPRWVSGIGVELIGRGVIASGEESGINFQALSPEYFAERLHVPVLIQASTADRVVPWDGARRLAELRPELVQLRSVAGAGHVRLWNVDPDGWEGSVQSFVTALPRPAWRG